MYKDIWIPALHEELSKKQPTNPHDKHAIKVMKDNRIVGHTPKTLSFVLLSGGSVRMRVNGSRDNKRNKGLEFPPMRGGSKSTFVRGVHKG